MSASSTFAEARPQYRDIRPEAYRAARQSSRYDRDEGLLVIPVMGPAGTAPWVVRVHAPYGVREVEFEYAKDRIPPLYPAQADTASGDVLLTSSLDFPTPTPRENGDLVFGVAGRYAFVQPDGGRGTEDTYPIDRMPYVSAIDAIVNYPPPTNDPERDYDWRWNSDSVDSRFLSSYGILR